jgi:hypothetical protein
MKNRFSALLFAGVPYAWILGAAIITLLMLIANPGYFSHDELQKLDHVRRFGIDNYMVEYLKIHTGDTFGTPVRPFSFAVQGLLALLMESYPVAVHLFGVVSHGLVACLLYALIVQLGGDAKFGLVAAFIFVVNPTAMLATGWSAALMDRLYIGFGLAALLCADHYVRKAGHPAWLLCVILLSALAMLSKETALVLPAMMLVIRFVDPATFRSKRFWTALVFWSVPVMAFFLVRLPALIASFGTPAVGAYKASISNVPEGLMVYLSYPFLWQLTEAINWVFIPVSWIWASLALHGAIIVSVGVIAGRRFAVAYCFFFLLFLGPILLIPIKAAHYLYGSGLVFSCAIAAILVYGGKCQSYFRSFGVVVFALLVVHSFFLQQFVYSVGSCMNKVMVGTDSIYMSKGRPKAVDFQAEAGAPEHILHRTFTGREQIGGAFPVRLSVSSAGAVPPEGTLRLVMNAKCEVREAH